MFSLKVENGAGQQFMLTGNETAYQVTKIDGLNPPNATIQSTTVAGMDGSRFASAKLTERNIVLTIKINGDVEANRLYLYQYFKTKNYCKIYYANGVRSVYAEGYVETIECDLFENSQTMQVSIVCHDPYLKDIDEMIYDISQIIGKFTFPFAFGAAGIVESTITDDAIEFSIIEKNNVVNIVNRGDTDCGFVVEIVALGAITNPIVYSVDTGEKISVDCMMVKGDVLTINTQAGKKSVTLTHDGTSINYLRHLVRGSSWLKVKHGDNQYSYSASHGEDLIQMLVRFRTMYEAV